MEQYDVWVNGELIPGWDKYTTKSFSSKEEARRWIRRYIPKAETMILPRRQP